jgi:predicted transcriptional regulator
MGRRGAKRLTDLELEVMQAVWEAGEPVTVRDVVERMAERGRELAYTTVQTMMNILRRKGALRSRPGPGRALVYRAGVSREAATASMTEDFVARLFGGRAEPLLARLIEHESLDRQTLAGLKRAIEDQLGTEERGDEGAEDGR